MSACTFFGHRDCIDLDPALLQAHLIDCINQGVGVFYVGNQGSFDSIVYRCLKSIQKDYPDICVSVVLAYLPTSKELSVQIADTMYPPIEGHPKYAIERRNRWMISHSTHLICYVNRPWGGAYKFYQTARRQGLKVINLGTYGQ